MAEHAADIAPAVGAVATPLEHPSASRSRCRTWTAACCSRGQFVRPRGSSSSSGPGPRLASEAAKRSRRSSPTTSMARSLGRRLRMFGSSRGGGESVGDADEGAVGEGTRAAESLGTGAFSACASGRVLSTTATTIPIPIASTTTSPAVTSRVLTPTFATVPRAHKRPRSSVSVRVGGALSARRAGRRQAASLAAGDSAAMTVSADTGMENIGKS